MIATPIFGPAFSLTQDNSDLWSPSILGLPGGRTAVTWTETGNAAIWLAFLDANGASEGAPISVMPQGETGNRPSLALLDRGNLVVTYTSLATSGPAAIRAQLFDQTGVATGSPTTIFETDEGTSVSPQNVALANGGFATLFTNFGLDGSSSGQFLRIADAGGTPVGDVVTVNQVTESFQTNGSMALLADGGLAVASDSRGVDGSVNAVVLRLFDADGTPRGDQLRVNQYSDGRQSDPDIAVLADGRIVVVWESEGQDGSDDGIYARLYSAQGTAEGDEFHVNTKTAGDQDDASVAATPDGGFMVAWTSELDSFEVEGRFQRFDSAGNPLGDEGLLPVGAPKLDNFPDLAIGADWSVQLTWLGAIEGEFQTNVFVSTGQLQESATIGADVVAGTQDDDVIFGLDGNDVINGGAGDDQIFGGAGIDLAVFSGARSEYTLDAGSAQISGLDGNDIVDGVERLRFDDGTLALDTDGAAGQAYRLYQAAFDRAPDLPGLTFWINTYDTGTLSLAEMAGYFIDSEEFVDLYGTATSVTDEGFITLLYNNVLNRDPDQDGFDFWETQAANGITRAEILQYFSESDENVANVSDQIADGIWYGLA